MYCISLLLLMIVQLIVFLHIMAIHLFSLPHTVFHFMNIHSLAIHPVMIIYTSTAVYENDSIVFIYFKDFIYLFLERGREGEREGEKHQCMTDTGCFPQVPPPPLGTLACNPSVLHGGTGN